MKYSFVKKILSTALACSMLVSTPGQVLTQSNVTLYAEESTEMDVYSEAYDSGASEEYHDPGFSEDVVDSSDPADYDDSAYDQGDSYDPELPDDYDAEGLPGMDEQIAENEEDDSWEEEEEDVLVDRTLKVSMRSQKVYEHDKVPTEKLKTVDELWQWLYGRDAEPDTNPSGDALSVKIQGELPEDVSAEAGFILFDEAKDYPERAIASIDIKLLRADGSEYIPESDLKVTIGGSSIKHVFNNGNPYILVYAHNEDSAAEALIVDVEEFSSHVTVYRELPQSSHEAQNEYWTKHAERLAYEKGHDHERITFYEDEDGLEMNRSKKNINFEVEEGKPLHFIVSAQNPYAAEPVEKATEPQMPVIDIENLVQDGQTDDAVEGQSDAITPAETEVQTEAQTEVPEAVEILGETETVEGSELDLQSDVQTEVQTDEVQTETVLSETVLPETEESVFETEEIPETETVVETEAVPETETVVETGAVPETETVIETEAVSEPELIIETETVETEVTETEAVSVTEFVIETEAVETEAVSESELVIEKDATETEAVTETEIVIETEAAEETEIEAEVETETEAETEPETENIVETETEAETETELEEEELLNRNLRVRTDEGSLVSVSGLMPTDVTAQALDEDATAYSEDLEGDGLLAVDISLSREPDSNSEVVSADQTDEEYQPEEPVRVIITDSAIGEAVKNNEELEVYHIADDGSNAKVENVRFVGSSAMFYADSFSVYVITGSNGIPRRTYQFYIWKDDTWMPYTFTSDTGEETSFQIVRNGQLPTIPNPTSDSEGKPFAGWYTYKEGSTTEFEDEIYNFNTPVTIDEVVPLYAQFKDYVYVIFHDQYNADSHSFPIAATRRAVPDETGKAIIQISDLSTTYSGGSDKAFYGWSYNPITEPGASRDDNGDLVSKIDTETIEVSAETHLYPIFKSVKWLSYWSGPTGSGATYCPAQEYFDGIGPSSLPGSDEIKRNGYTFQGWYAGVEDEEGNVTYGQYPISNPDGSLINGVSDGGMSVYGGHLHLSNDATLYAMWDGGETTSYKIIIWKQKTTADSSTAAQYKYDFVGSHIKTVPVGTAATTDGYRQELSGYQCRWDSDVPANDENLLKGDTILNVYYDREGVYTSSGNAHNLRFVNTADASTLAVYTGDTAVSYQADLLTGNSGESYVPGDPKRAHYIFTGWFADQNCTTQVFFSENDLDAYTGNNKTVLYDKMPDNDLTIYAGWEAEWYLVRIDPNYGDFHGSGATWTWKTIESDLIQEYTQVTRDYVESSSGTYYYVKHDRAYYGYNDNKYYNDEPSERDARYTNQPGEATEYKTFEEARGVYSYAGWFEVLEDGTEVPYDFSKHVDHHTQIRLHWKKAGAFYIKYDAGDGTMDTGGKEANDTNAYADNAQIEITRGAVAPDGYTFVGWSIKGDTSDSVYKQTDLFTLQSDYAVSISGKETITLEAVYVKLETASVIYDFNGGTANSTFDFGHPEDSRAPQVETSLATDGKSAEIGGLVNNSGFYLSDGTGLTMTNATLKGWSNKSAYDPDDEEAEFYELGAKTQDGILAQKGLYGVDTEEPVRIYAVWEVKATYHLNVPDGEVDHYYNWGGNWDVSKYAMEEGNYVETLFTGDTVSEPEYVPEYTGSSSITFLYWATKDDNQYVAYDFSQPVTGTLDLYACWGASEEVTVHAVDASGEVLSDATNTSGWSVNDIKAGTSVTPLSESSHVNAPANYAFAFAAVASNLDSVSDTNKVNAVKYDSSDRSVHVRFEGEDSFSVLDDNSDIYFVYYQKKELTIGNKEMSQSGVLTDVTGMTEGSTGSASEDLLGSYTVPTNVDYLGAANSKNHSYTNYAFAVGKADLEDSTEMNASDLSMITTAAGAGDPVPTLQIRNTWRGFEYTTSTGTDAVWTNCGYSPELYVIYYEQKPTVVMFREKTIGLNTNTVIKKSFSYDLLVTETTTNVQKQRLSGSNWVNDGNTTEVTSEIFNTAVAPNTQYILTDGDAKSAILFYSTPTEGEAIGEVFTEGDVSYRYVATASSVTTQTAVITQDTESDFTTAINDTVQDTEPYSYTCTSDGSGGTVAVTFTNKHKAADIEVHVARVENGAINLQDGLRGSDEATYRFSLPIDEEKKLLTALPADTVYADASGVYTFGAVVYGSDDGTTVAIEGMGVESISYESVKDNLYELLLKDGSGNQLNEMGTYKIYYLYYPMPRIQYVKQEGTTLSLIRGSTDGINPSTMITYDRAELQMNGVTVDQNQRISLPLSYLTISQATGVKNFKMPPVLDDETFIRYLSYSSIAMGSGISSGETQDISALGTNISSDLEMYLRVSNNALQWSFDGSSWHSMSESQAIYAIYQESGYDLQISKIIDTSHVEPETSRGKPIFKDREFTVTIEPATGNSFNKERYDIEGYSSETVAVEDGKITLTVGDGTKVKLHGMKRGSYTITESNNENFDLTAKSGPIVENATTTETVTNNSVSIALDTEKQIVLTNSPKAICEVTIGNDEDGVPFYTLADAVNHIVNDISDRTANIEMLVDYLMPAEDTLVIPLGAHITLTTAKAGTQQYSGSGRAVIRRSTDLSSSSMITNSGELELINITVDGNSVEASVPMMQSTGTLTVDRGVTLRNAISSGNGGAIYAKGTVSFIGSIDVSLRNNRAVNGGLLYYAGTGTVTISAGNINGNSATENGGAVYAEAGTVLVTGGTITGNGILNGTAVTENGGAIYADNAGIEISGNASISGNAVTQNGGAVCSASGTISISSGSISNNNAAEDGGAIYAGTGDITMTDGSIFGNAATNGDGGAIYAGSGVVKVSGGTIGGKRDTSANTAVNGGAIYAGSGKIDVSGGSLTGNIAQTSGGAIYALSGGVNISGTSTSLYSNTVTNGNGGAVYAGGGAVTLTDAKLYTNFAMNGYGGAIYVDSGSVTVSSGVIGGDNGGNEAKNGAGVFINTGNGIFSGGLIKNNVASEGGAVGVNSDTVRLRFSGNPIIQNNTLGEGGSASNVYLNQDTNGVINTTGMSGGYVGIYVPDSITVPDPTVEKPERTKIIELFRKRGDVGTEFGMYNGTSTSSFTITQFHNDRETNLNAVVDITTLQVYWSSQIRVEVRYLGSFSSSIPNGTNGDQKLSPTTYNPKSGGVSLSVLADELRGKCSGLSSTAVYATALVEGDYDYNHYLTQLLWENGKWEIKKRDGSQESLNGKKIVIYYADPAFLSIENNTAFDFDMSSLTVKLANADRSVLNGATSEGPTGFGLVFARDGSIQTELRPVEMTDGKLTLTKNGGSIIILIPGGRNVNYALKGSFRDGAGIVMLRRNGTTESDLDAKNPVTLTGKTFNNTNTYEIVFGEDKAICRIRCADQTNADPAEYVDRTIDADSEGKYEYTFARMRDAVTFAKNHRLSEFTIEMLVDYLMPGTDAVMVTNNEEYKTEYEADSAHAGHPSFIVFEDLTAINFSTATTGYFTYPGTDPNRRATISRGNGNTLVPLLYIAGPKNTINITSSIHDLDFDGKNLTGACDGGALKTINAKVVVNNSGFKNFIALNGGAVFVGFGKEIPVSNDKTEYNFQYFSGGMRFWEPYSAGDEKDDFYREKAVFTISNSSFKLCESQAKKQRSGGGAIWTNARTLSMTGCSFDTCKAVTGNANNQGGAVFHRIDSKTQKSYAWQPYAKVSETQMTGCTFNNCSSNAGGGIETDSQNAYVTDCDFIKCTTSSKDGGAINIYIYENSMTYNDNPSEVHLTGCHFISCTSARNGGAIRSLAVDTKIKNCEFTNISARGNSEANGGGAVYVSNTAAKTTTIRESTFNGCKVTNNGSGGAVNTTAKQLTVVNSSILNCEASNNNGNGGGIYHNNNAAGSATSIVDSTISGCTARKSGGGVYSNARNKEDEVDDQGNPTPKKLLVRSFITGCTATNISGGGIYLSDYSNSMYATVEGSTITNCTANVSGGGLFCQSKYLRINSSNDPVSGDVVLTELSSCEAKSGSGGGIYQSRTGSEASLANFTIDGCTAKVNGGGYYTDKASSIFVNGKILNNESSGNGGGIYHGSTSELKLTDTTISGNKANTYGGGIYTAKYLTLVKSIIESNQLTNKSNTVDNAAGVYMTNDGILVIGTSSSNVDNSAVKNNTTLNGSDSNLRLPVNSNGENKNCVTVNCGLGTIEGKGGYIGVTNAWKVGTQFGTSNISGDPTGLKDPDGVVVKDSVFNADTSTLYGIISRTDDTRKKIVWAGPPICKITDEEGNLLYFKPNGSDPAIFDVLEDGAASGRTSAFSLLRGTPTLYYAPSTEGGSNGAVYTGSSFTIKMLVDTYELTNQITTVNSAGKTITLTTAAKGDKDGYPFDNDSSETRCSITRGSGVTGSMMVASTNMKFRNILLDGGNITSTQAGAIVRVAGTVDITVEMLANSVMQYGKALNGGAVSVTNGTFSQNAGLIRFCEATENGGAVYSANSDPEKGYVLDSGNIQQCTAAKGGGIYVADGAATMNSGNIYGCVAGESGGGVYVAGSKTFSMSGGNIGRSIANTAGIKGGGIAVGEDAVLNFSGQVNVSKNTCKGNTCNVELDQDSNSIINTNGLYSRSFIGVYVSGTYIPLTDEDNAAGKTHNDGDEGPYKSHGGQGDPFGSFSGSSSNLYCFFNDRNGLKGGVISNPVPNTIYWIKIFSIEVSKEVEVSENVPNGVKNAVAEQEFSYTVRLWDTPYNTSGIKVKDIAEEIASSADAGEDSRYGAIPFETVSGSDTVISATITLKSGEALTAENLPDGLGYDVTEAYVTGYSNIPMKKNGDHYQFDPTRPVYIQEGTTGENKDITNDPDINPYVSAVKFTNILPVCKITDASGNLLYRNSQLTSDKQTPAVYKELSEAIATVNSGTLYTSNSDVSYSGAMKIEMLLPEYTLTSEQEITSSRKVTLTTAAVNASDRFPFNPTSEALSTGTTWATIKRGTEFTVDSMLTLSASSDMTLTNVKLDGNLIEADSGLVYVHSDAALRVTDGARLQNSRTTSDGAGVYLEENSKLYLSGDPVFGGTDTDAYGYLYNTTGNFKIGTLTGQTNGKRAYTVAHQDIFIAGYSGEEGDTSADSLIINGNINSQKGSIWVWADESPHYKSSQQFAKIDSEESISDTALAAFRNARDDDITNNETQKYLYGVTKDGVNVLWNSKPICKLTNSDDALLYEHISGNNYSPAVYGTVKEGFDAAGKNLYRKAGSAFALYTDAIKLKMLEDYDLGGGEIITYGLGRNLIFTTAETNISAKMEENGDEYIYQPAITTDSDRQTKATLTRSQSEASMFTVNTPSSNSFTVTDLIIDGNDTTTNVDGGIFHVTTGSLVIASGATLTRSIAANGGAVYVNANASAEMSDGEITGCKAANGGAVYVNANATMTLKDGQKAAGATKAPHATINGNTATTVGAGIYLTKGSTLNLSGNPYFGGTGTNDAGELITTTGTVGNEPAGNFISMSSTDLKTAGQSESEEPKNGGKSYPADSENGKRLVRQDIYLHGYADENQALPSIVLMDNLAEGLPAGSIWVWANDVDSSNNSLNHYQMLHQFAVLSGSFAGTSVSDTTYRAFRNARPDAFTECGGDYLTGQAGEDIGDTKCIYWTGGYDFSFLKVDGYGKPVMGVAEGETLTGATFTLYTQKVDASGNELKDSDGNPQLEEWQRSGKAVTAASSDGIVANFPDPEDDTKALPLGTVLFRKIPPNKVFYMKETQTPEITKSDGTKEKPFEDNTTIYKVILNEKGELSIYTRDPESTATPVADQFTVEVYKVETKAAQGTNPAEYQYHVMNVSKMKRKVILRKVDTAYTPLPLLKFNLCAIDGTIIEKDLVSTSSGVFYIGTLPYGLYLIDETNAGSYHTPEEGEYFRFGVNEKGVVEWSEEEESGEYNVNTQTTNELRLSEGSSIENTQDTQNPGGDTGNTGGGGDTGGNGNGNGGGNTTNPSDDNTGDDNTSGGVIGGDTGGGNTGGGDTGGGSSSDDTNNASASVTTQGPYHVSDVIQVAITIDGKAYDSSEYGVYFSITSPDAEIVFIHNNSGITLLQSGEEVTLIIKVENPMWDPVLQKTIPAGYEATVKISVEKKDSGTKTVSAEIDIDDTNATLTIQHVAEDSSYTEQDIDAIVADGGLKKGLLYTKGSDVYFCYNSVADKDTIRYNSGSGLLKLTDFSYSSDGNLVYTGTPVDGSSDTFYAGRGSIVKQNGKYYIAYSYNNVYENVKCEEETERMYRII